MQAKNLELITQLRHELHAHPELSGKESETRRRLQDFLRAHTDFTIHDEGAWFWLKIDAEAPKERPIAFRADFDALPIPESLELPYASTNPGVAHKCGHDGHSASLVGLALELRDRAPSRDVYLIFQPAEETGAGGYPCSTLIARESIGEVYAFHNWSGIPRGCVALKRGVSQCASQGLSLKFKGITTHASNPQAGRNPSQAISRLVLFTEELAGGHYSQEQTPGFNKFVLATVVGISAGGRDFGISASVGEVNLTLRAEDEADLKVLKQKICQAAADFAQADGLELTHTDCDVFPETRNDDAAIEVVAQAAERAGLPVHYLERPFRASEDFGHYLKQAPGAMVYIGNGWDYPPLHTTEYDFIDGNLEVAVNLWLAVLGFCPR